MIAQLVPDRDDEAGQGDIDEARTEIRVLPGERHNAADEGVAALLEAGTEFYRRDRHLVRICEINVRSTAGDVIVVPAIAGVTKAILGRALGRAARWKRQDKNGQWVPFDPPEAVVEQILGMADKLRFPALAGVIGCPTLRPDGSLLAAEGYDAATGLVLISTVAMPRLSESPTRRNAEDAAVLLASLLEEFPFAGDVDRAAAMSMLLTPVLRGAMPVVPLHLVTAPQPGTGKSYLADVASMIATGERAAVVAVAPESKETEARLVGAALAGHPIIALDNCRQPLAGDFLCQVTERPLMQLRGLGRSDAIRVANTFSVFANGNNISVADDMVRRSVGCRLDADTEDPERRAFLGNPLAAVRRNRGAYVAACLTIARAYFAAGKPNRLTPLPSFEAWSDTVRSALVWLGFADPLASMAAARSADPVRLERAVVFEAWRADLGTDGGYTAAEIIARCEADALDTCYSPNLAAALAEHAQKRGGPPGKLDARRLGRWLTTHEGTVVGELKLTVDRTDARRPRYRLRAASP